MDPLVTAEDLATYLQRDLDTAAAEFAVAGASGLVRAYCRWPVSRVAETVTLSGDGGRLLSLPTLRLVTLGPVTVGGAAVTDFTASPGGQLFRASGWPVGLGNVTAEMTHGYAPVPDEVRIVACSVAAKLYSNPESLVAKSSGDDGRTFSVLSGLEMSLISSYRRD